MAELALADGLARRLAAATFDWNVVVTASAGTGKTTLLVERLVHLLLRSAHPVSLTEIVALTFMDKAANDMKARLRARLQGLVDKPGAATDITSLAASEVRARAASALQEVERSQIGTIHSFAAHLIRLYPLEAGVDPGFAPDDGRRFEQHFTQQWAEWLNGELTPCSARAQQWRQVLRRTSLDSLRELAKQLANDLVPLNVLESQLDAQALSPVLAHWLEQNRARARALLSASQNGEKEPRQVEKLLVAAAEVFTRVSALGPVGLTDIQNDLKTLLLDKSAGSKPPVGWSESDFDEAQVLIDAAKALLEVDHDFLATVLRLVIPFARDCRQRFVESGFVSFDGLLARARDLLKNHAQVRRRLKHQFKAILVDEFQDTDPVQYEILLFLAERTEDAARRWQDVQLQAGKLFIVGDPKQSIFAFRRADIEAFQHVTERVVEQGGYGATLTTNFRSHASILSVVNGMFERLMLPRPGLQPAYDVLEPQPERQTSADVQGVELRLVIEDDEDDEEELTAERAVRAEAEANARWLKREIIGKVMLTDGSGARRHVAPGDVAILFRTFSQGREYLDALRRHGLPYVAEGEKHFYQRQEVVDFVNLLRWIQNPDDGIARLGVLRAPLGALTDREIIELTALNALDYRGGRHANLSQHGKAAHLLRLYSVLQILHEECPRRALSDALEVIFDRLPVLELAAVSLHGEQAVANLWKVRALTEELAEDPGLTLAGLVALLAGRITNPPEESESGLAEETLEAVRVLTIHKAKGLEFPIVILVGLQAGTGSRSQKDPVQVHHDWSSNVAGIRLDDVMTLEGVFVAEKLEARMAAERCRLLYVGMTRAKERLVLSGALTKRRTQGNFLDLCKEAIGGEVGGQDVTMLAMGDGTITQTILTAEEGKFALRKTREKAQTPKDDVEDYVTRWQHREQSYQKRLAVSLVVTPSALTETPGFTRVRVSPGTPASVLGSLVHAVLEQWSYDKDPQCLLEACEQMVARHLPEECALQRDEVLSNLLEMLMGFSQSEAYRELQNATILAREIPFIMPACAIATPGKFLIEGRIDLIYEKNGSLWVADYKTDRLGESDLSARVDTYREQARCYLAAVREGLGRAPGGFKFIFVRAGKAVPVAI